MWGYRTLYADPLAWICGWVELDPLDVRKLCSPCLQRVFCALEKQRITAHCFYELQNDYLGSKKNFCKIKGEVFMPYWHSEDCRGLVPGALKAPPIHRFYHLHISLSTGVQKMEPLQWMWAICIWMWAICICQVDITLSPCYCIQVIVTLSEASN